MSFWGMIMNFMNGELIDLVNQTDIEELRKTFTQSECRQVAKDILDLASGHRLSSDNCFNIYDMSDIYYMFNWHVGNSLLAFMKAVKLATFFEWEEKHPEWEEKYIEMLEKHPEYL